MSATETESTTLDLDNLPDGRIEDKEGYLAARAALVKAGKAAVGAAKKAYGATDVYAAARALIRSFILLPSGHPDWAGRSDAYSLAVQSFDNDVMTNLAPEEKRRFDDAVRKQMNRKHTFPTVVGYTLAHTNGLGDELALWNKDEAGRLHVLANPSTKLVKAVREAYASTAHGKKAAMLIPDAYVAFAEKHEAPVVDPKDPPNVLAALRTSLAGLANIVPLAALFAALETLSGLCKGLTDGKVSEIKDRAKCVAVLRRLALICETTANLIDTDTRDKVTDEERDALTAALFDKETDTL